jgi:hypothetical protein
MQWPLAAAEAAAGMTAVSRNVQFGKCSVCSNTGAQQVHLDETGLHLQMCIALLQVALLAQQLSSRLLLLSLKLALFKQTKCHSLPQPGKEHCPTLRKLLLLLPAPG